jgi:hypothetical protein
MVSFTIFTASVRNIVDTLLYRIDLIMIVEKETGNTNAIETLCTIIYIYIHTYNFRFVSLPLAEGRADR